MAPLITRDVLIPLAPDQAVNAGWPAETGARPWAVTWHWTVTWDLALCTRLLGGPDADRKGVTSAHYGVGRSLAEGVDRYVALENRSWHAGKNQKVRWDGDPFTAAADKGARTTVGVETVTIGYAREGFPAEDDWIVADTPEGKRYTVQPWTEEQVELMIAVGREIVARWPHIGIRHHHGHHDLCPTYKQDVVGFPFARVLRGIYDDPAVPDVWGPLWTVRQRQRVLEALGFDPQGVDDRWGPNTRGALESLQEANGLAVNGFWTTFVNWHVHDLLAAAGQDLASVAGD